MVNFGKKLKERQFPEWQRYHVPRSWLHPTNNVLVLLEEIGGDSSGIGGDPSRDHRAAAAAEEP